MISADKRADWAKYFRYLAFNLSHLLILHEISPFAWNQDMVDISNKTLLMMLIVLVGLDWFLGDNAKKQA